MENQPNEHCRNCNNPLPPDARFCPSCGQKNTDGRLTFRQLIRDFLDHLLNLDARIFSTLKALAIPGKLTVNYFSGKHVPYYHPVRLFIVAAGLFTALLLLTLNKAGLQEAGNDFETKVEQLKYYELLDSISSEAKKKFKEPEVARALDTVIVHFAGEDLDSLTGDSILLKPGIGFFTQNKQVAIKDLMVYTEDALVKRYEIKGFWNQLFFRQGVRITKSATKFLVYLIGNTIWMMFVMMPMLALVLKLLYIRRRYLFYEHLLFSFHTHTFVFLYYALFMAAGKMVSGEIIGISFIGAALYLLLAMKRFYSQGWWKTIIKFGLTNFLYIFIFFFAFVLMLIVSAAIF